MDVARADLTASQSSLATASSELEQLRADSLRSTSQVLDLTFAADSLRLQLSSLQASIFPAALDSLRSERDRY